MAISVDSFCKPILIHNIAASIASKAILSKINSVWNFALFRIYGVSGEQLRLVQLYTNSLPLHTQVLLCPRKFLLASRCVKNGVLELLATIYGAKELDVCDSRLTTDYLRHSFICFSFFLCLLFATIIW